MTYIASGIRVSRNFGTGAHGALSASGNITGYGADDGSGVRLIQATTFASAGNITLNKPITVIRATTSITISHQLDGTGQGSAGGGGGPGTTNGHGSPGVGAGFGGGGQWSGTNTPGGGGGGGHVAAGTDGSSPGSAGGKGGSILGRSGLLGSFPLTDSTALLLTAGGGGGGGGNGNPGQAGGAGGAGSAVLALIAPQIILNTGTSILLVGTAGTAAGPNAAGGGGGAGGALYLAGGTLTFPGSGTVVNCSSGAGGGNGGGSGGTGGAGSNGYVLVCWKNAITAGYSARIANATVDEVRTV